MIRKSRKSLICFFAFLLLGAFIGAEIYIRINYKNAIPGKPERPLVYEPDSLIGYRYIPGSVFKINKRVIRINQAGFIGEELAPKNPDKFRIAIVGNSTVAGSINKIRFVTFSDYLQDLFNENHYSVEVVNCGMDGSFRDYELLKYIESDVLKIEPDLLLLGYPMPLYSNNTARESYGGIIMNYSKGDFQERAQQMKKIDKLNKQKPFIDLLYNSYIARAIFKWHRNKKPSSALTANLNIYNDRSTYQKLKLNALLESKSCQMIKEIQHEINQKGGRFFMFGLGHNPDAIEFCRENNLPYMDLYKVGLNEEDFFYKDWHVNESGAAKVAANFYDIITKHNLVKPKYRLEK